MTLARGHVAVRRHQTKRGRAGHHHLHVSRESRPPRRHDRRPLALEHRVPPPWIIRWLDALPKESFLELIVVVNLVHDVGLLARAPSSLAPMDSRYRTRSLFSAIAIAGTQSKLRSRRTSSRTRVFRR